MIETAMVSDAVVSMLRCALTRVTMMPNVEMDLNGPDGLCRPPRFTCRRLSRRCRMPLRSVSGSWCDLHSDCGDGFCMDFACIDSYLVHVTVLMAGIV